ncbi:hypothetical protein BGZ94_003389 [Podila epigama]|nr:hypothetical protein BGZ94_003389 [Podila epigama]
MLATITPFRSITRTAPSILSSVLGSPRAYTAHTKNTQQQPPQRPIRDPSYPFPLYLHPLPKQTTTTTTPDYALSFLPIFPHINEQLIGYLKHSTLQNDLQRLREGEHLIKPSHFIENEAFNKVLHTVIQDHLADDPMVLSVLQQQLEGWTHIADYRNPAPYGRIPLPEDIFGSVQIVEGVVQSSTYQRMPTHRIVSSNGLFLLSDYIHEKLLGHLQNLS